VPRDHPELLRPVFNEAEHQKKDYSVHLDNAELELFAKLETLVESKNSVSDSCVLSHLC
jgi:hypothetical protein